MDKIIGIGNALVDVLVDALEDLVVPVRLGQVFNVYHLRAASFPESGSVL